jgi:hypothetical protein
MEYLAGAIIGPIASIIGTLAMAALVASALSFFAGYFVGRSRA